MHPRIRQFFDVLPPVLLVIGAMVLAWRMYRDQLDPRFAALLAAAVLFELASSFMDAVLVQSLDEKLAHRVIGFVAGCVLLFGMIAGLFFLTRGWGASGVWVVLVLLVPRFFTFVLEPPRQPLERMRVKALADDRLESVFVMIGLVPFLFVPAFVAVAAGIEPTTFRPILAVPGVLLAAWFGLRAAAAWHASSPAFARRPQRLLSRAPWPWIAYWFAKARARDDARIAREAELAAVHDYQSRAAGDGRGAA